MNQMENEELIVQAKKESKVIQRAMIPLLDMCALSHLRYENIHFEKLPEKEIAIREDEIRKTIDMCLSQMKQILQIPK